MSKKLYISFGQDGVMDGRYNSRLHEVIPASAVEVPVALFERTLAEDDGEWFINAEKVIAKRPFGPPPFNERNAILAVRNHMDEAAHAAGYDNIAVAVSYAEEPAVPKFQTEGLAFRAWRSLCWEHCFAVLAKPKGITIAQLVSQLPKLKKA